MVEGVKLLKFQYKINYSTEEAVKKFFTPSFINQQLVKRYSLPF